ncbi:MAG: hypothetical protein ACQETJ_07040 [Bacteroidota bacterium]
MKKTIKLLGLLLTVTFLFHSCDLLNNEETDPEKTMGKPGNYWAAIVPGHDDAELTINENNDGNVVATIIFDGTSHTVEGKVTDKGIYDYVYSNGNKKKPFTLVKFDAKVGDKWEFNVGNKKVVREVVRKSTEDDTEYVFWLVKTIDVEETIPAGTMINGAETEIKKILWKMNHKYGFIAATVTKNDGSTVEVSGVYTNAADE